MKTVSLVYSLFALMMFQANANDSLYDCHSVRPEMPGSHNMVLFGDPDDKIYTYHLPLFKGAVNGQSGHVFMHVYQGLWDINLDTKTMTEYKNKFLSKKTETQPFPFFSISPRGQKFKVPEMICDHSFKTDVIAVYGHVEGNPNFPSPELLIDQLSELSVNKTLFARKFDGGSKDQLTYIAFGTGKQIFLVHYLTDDENSFDQIVSVEIEDSDLKQNILNGELTVLTVPKELNENLVTLSEAKGNNNKFSLPTMPIGQSVKGIFNDKTYHIEISGEVYFNNNSDLKITL